MFRAVMVVGAGRDRYSAWSEALRAEGFGTVQCALDDDALPLIDDADIDVVLVAVGDRVERARDVCDAIARHRPQVSTIAIGPELSFDELLALVHAGAADYLVEPVAGELLIERIARLTRRPKVTADRNPLDLGEGRYNLVGRSPAMVSLLDTLERAASTDATVLITGESGTGKELIARALHDLGDRGDRPFIAINCSALPAPLLESELFGHEKGAFTDARDTRIGLLVAAGDGTIFLDEIGDMPMPLQPKLLRALQERSVRPVGSNSEQPLRARIIAATNRDLGAAIADGSFREDLFYRLDVVRIQVPPLRARVDDIVPLARYNLRKFAEQLEKPVKTIADEAVRHLLDYPWPGNVRELQNCIERAVAMTRHDTIQVADLPARLRKVVRPRENTAPPTTPASLEEVERAHILEVLARVDGNRREAARILQVDRKTLYRRLRKYGLMPARASSQAEDATPEKGG